jgi:hypothetical protein
MDRRAAEAAADEAGPSEALLLVGSTCKDIKYRRDLR